MSVQIQYNDNDKFIKFSPDVTTVRSLLTMALDIIHGNLFRNYERFPKRLPLFFYYENTYIYLSKIQTFTN